MKKIRKNTKIGGITALGSVSFMVGWLDGWMVGWLDTFFFSHFGPNPTIYPSFARKNLAPLGITVNSKVIKLFLNIRENPPP